MQMMCAAGKMNLLTIVTKISLIVMGGSKYSVKLIEKVVRSQAKVSRPQEFVKSVPLPSEVISLTSGRKDR